MRVLACRLAGEDPITSRQYDVAAPVLDGDYAYWRVLNDHWGTDVTLVNVEHDMEFSDELVDGLLACPHPLCAYAYKVWPSAWRKYVYAQFRDGRWIEHGVEHADFSSIGFCKVSASARHGALKKYPWRFVEQSVNEAVTGDWHIHWPEIAHHHDYETQQMTPWQMFVGKFA